VALPWTPVKPEEWHLVPHGAIVVLDECQRMFAPRQRGKEQPVWAKMLETHRQLGIDLYLITQHPTLIDSHDRKLVGTHYYVRRKFGSGWKTIYTFKGCADYPEKVFSTRNIDERQAGDNKAAFAWYKSTERNTTKRAIPKKVWVLVFCIIAVPALLGSVAWRVKARHDAQAAGAAAPAASAPGSFVGAPSAGRGEARSSLSPTEYAMQFAPRVRGLAYTAPAYDESTRPTEAPYPAACIQTRTRCNCYTQQGTALETTPAICAGIVAGGFFVPWARPEPHRAASAPL
jgi:zona occludens toxin